MPYQKKTIRILTGGLNLQLPGEQIDDTEAQELINISVNSYGALQSRAGHTVILASHGAPVTQITRALGTIWRVSGGGAVWNGDTPVGDLGAVGMLVGWDGYVWAMSSNDQMKSTGTNWWNWVPAAPTDPLTAVAAAPVSVTVVGLT